VHQVRDQYKHFLGWWLSPDLQCNPWTIRSLFFKKNEYEEYPTVPYLRTSFPRWPFLFQA
jgi:hypothetical protein